MAEPPRYVPKSKGKCPCCQRDVVRSPVRFRVGRRRLTFFNAKHLLNWLQKLQVFTARNLELALLRGWARTAETQDEVDDIYDKLREMFPLAEAQSLHDLERVMRESFTIRNHLTFRRLRMQEQQRALEDEANQRLLQLRLPPSSSGLRLPSWVSEKTAEILESRRKSGFHQRS